MESVTSSVWLHVSTSTYLDREYGVIFTSNSNGTYFGLSLDNVNRNGQGIVDFEKMQGIEGIALANQVINTKEVNAGNPKKLKTMITFDDGASWRLLDKPALDPYGKPYDCKVNIMFLCLSRCGLLSTKRDWHSLIYSIYKLITL